MPASTKFLFVFDKNFLKQSTLSSKSIGTFFRTRNFSEKNSIVLFFREKIYVLYFPILLFNIAGFFDENFKEKIGQVGLLSMHFCAKMRLESIKGCQ